MLKNCKLGQKNVHVRGKMKHGFTRTKYTSRKKNIIHGSPKKNDSAQISKERGTHSIKKHQDSIIMHIYGI